MYSRPIKEDMRIPHNYSGSIFRQIRTPPKAETEISTQNNKDFDDTSPLTDIPTPSQPCYVAQDTSNTAEACNTEDSTKNQSQYHNKKDHSLLSPIGALGTEEILLIALALIIFQGGVEPQLALILLALLFIN